MPEIRNANPEILSEITGTTAISFELENPGPFFVIWANFSTPEERLLIWDGDAFVTPFKAKSTLTIDSGTWFFSLAPDVAWPTGLDGITIEPAEIGSQLVEFIGAVAGGVDEFTTPGGEFDLILPLGTEAGDFVQVCQQMATTSPFETGYTQYANYFRSHFGGGTRHQAAWKFLTQDEVDVGSLHFNNAGGGAIAASLQVFRNVHPTDPITDSRVGTNSGDPAIECPGAGCHTAAMSGTGSPMTYWGTGFLTPYNFVYPGSMLAGTFGGGSGGGGGSNPLGIQGPTGASVAITNSIFWTSHSQFSTIRVRGAGTWNWLLDDAKGLLVPYEVPNFTGGIITYNQGLGTTLILRPREGL